jgi:hypothetical protein
MKPPRTYSHCCSCKRARRKTGRRSLEKGWYRGLCGSCVKIRRAEGTFELYAMPARVVEPSEFRETPDGYILRPKPGSSGYYPEHRTVMEHKLGRALRPGENVHHINGVRNDNRPENLELWVVAQPSGQRVFDLIAYILDLHAEELAAEVARRGGSLKA